MDIKDLRGLMEAYQQVNALIDEATYSAKAARAGKDIGKPGKQFAKIAKSAAERYGSKERGEKVAGAVLAKLRKEELDIFDTILEFLYVEGYAETLEEAEWIMSNELDAEDIEAILEGSYEDRIAANNKKYDANRKRAAQRAAARNAARDAGQTGAVPGVGYVTPRRERETYTDSAGKTRHAKGL